MEKHTEIPQIDGLYWYFEEGKIEPIPVLVNVVRYPNRMKFYSGAEQAWMRTGEYLVGPQAAPQPQI